MSSRKDGDTPMLIQSTLRGIECDNIPDMPFKSSKLSASFPDMLKDTSTLSMLDYFIQFMDTVQAIHLIQFWLSVESFRATISSREQPRTKEHPKSFERRKKKVLSSASSISSSGSDSTGLLTHENGLDASGVENTRTGHSRDLSRKSGGVRGNGGNITTADRGSPGSVLRNDSEVRSGFSEGGDNPRGNGDGKSWTNPGNNNSNKTGFMNEGVKKLHRRDTENHMYCNCKVHVIATPPGTPESPRENGKPVILQDSSPSIVVRCEHGTADQAAMDNESSSSRPAPDQISNQSAEEDALGIYSKYLALNAAQPVGITDEIRQQVEVSICPEDGNISNSCFDDSQKYVYDIMRTKYFPRFLHSSFLCKYQLEYIASGNLNLTDFLLGETALSYFMEFMEQEQMSHMLQFWLIADSFHNEFSSSSHVPNLETDIRDAMIIYDRYLSLQARESLKMEDSVRLDVENRICDEHGPRADSFLRPQLVAFHTMNELYYPAFKESTIYLRFLNELLTTLKKEDDRAHAAPSPTAGEDSPEVKSDVGITGQNHVQSFAAFIMGEDLDDVNSLYSRPCFLFRLGYVNDMGEYISEIDSPESSKKEGGHSWSSTARSRRKRKKEKELSMKISRNIIKEVLAMGSTKVSSHKES